MGASANAELSEVLTLCTLRLSLANARSARYRAVYNPPLQSAPLQREMCRGEGGAGVGGFWKEPGDMLLASFNEPPDHPGLTRLFRNTPLVCTPKHC